MMAAVSSIALQSVPVPVPVQVPELTGGRQQVPAEEHPTEGERGTVNSVWSKHKVYSLLQSAAARNAFVKHAERTAKEGILDKNQKQLPTLPIRTDANGNRHVNVPENDPEFYRHSHLEEKYGKPEGFVCLSPAFSPTLKIKKDSVQRTRAIRNLPNDASADDINNMMVLQVELYKIVADVATSKATLLLLDLTQQAKITLEDGTPAIRPDQLKDLWYKDPNRNLAKEIYEIGFGSREDGITFPKNILNIIVHLGIWFPVSGELSEYSKRGPVMVPKTSFVSSIWHNKFRELVRRNLLGDRSPHGVTITISTDKKDNKEEEEESTHSISNNGKKAARRKKRFIWETNVKGWDSTKHRNWKQNKVSGGTIRDQPTSVVSAFFFMFTLHICNFRCLPELLRCTDPLTIMPRSLPLLKPVILDRFLFFRTLMVGLVPKEFRISQACFHH